MKVNKKCRCIGIVGDSKVGKRWAGEVALTFLFSIYFTIGKAEVEVSLC